MERILNAIKDSGMTMVAISKKTGIDRRTLYNRFHGGGEFTLSEIVRLTEALRLTTEERDRIFFGDNDT